MFQNFSYTLYALTFFLYMSYKLVFLSASVQIFTLKYSISLHNSLYESNLLNLPIEFLISLIVLFILKILMWVINFFYSFQVSVYVLFIILDLMGSYFKVWFSELYDQNFQCYLCCVLFSFCSFVWFWSYCLIIFMCLVCFILWTDYCILTS